MQATRVRKMAPRPSPHMADTANTEQQEEERDAAADDTDWDLQSTPQPLIDYKRLAIEVATRIAPD